MGLELIYEVFSNRMAGSPEQAARDHFHVIILQHGFVMVADRGTEHTGLIGTKFIDPNVGMHLAGLIRLRFGQRYRVWVNGFDVIELTLRSRPIFHALQDFVLIIDYFDFKGVLGAVPRRVNAAELPPLFGGWPRTVAVHGAVNQKSGNSIEMGLENAVNIIDISDVCETFIVDDYIVAVGPMRVFVEFEQGIARFGTLVKDRPFDWQLALQVDGSGNDLSLLVVIMATTSGHEERPDRSGLCQSSA